MAYKILFWPHNSSMLMNCNIQINMSIYPNIVNFFISPVRSVGLVSQKLNKAAVETKVENSWSTASIH